MFAATVKPICSKGRCGSWIGEASSAGKAGTGETGESTKSKGALAFSAASLIASIWLMPR